MAVKVGTEGEHVRPGLARRLIDPSPPEFTFEAPIDLWAGDARPDTPATWLARAHARFMQLTRRQRTLIELALTIIIGWLVPFFTIWALWSWTGIDISETIHVTVAAIVAGQAALVAVESYVGFAPTIAPTPPAGPPSPAALIVAAYLPNEQDVILDTIAAMLAVTYRGPMRVIVAYNTPVDLPAVEQALWDVAFRDERLVPLRVHGSTSKAHNVNTALHMLTPGERIVGIFDADHRPEPDVLERAWQWLSPKYDHHRAPDTGHDVVQGRCVVSNAHASFVANMVACEFEHIYGVSHPGRTRFHGWGIFGGTNGFWRVDRFRQLGGFDEGMLTEDIDSSIRALLAGARIGTDRAIVSRELATVTPAQLVKQRLRWAQGWFEVSRRHGKAFTANKNLTVRQRLGGFMMLRWRDVYMWASMQLWPTVAFGFLVRGGVNPFEPWWLLAAGLTVTAGTAQSWIAILHRDRRAVSRAWMLRYLVLAPWYAEVKNAIARVAHLRSILRDVEWVVTRRVIGSIEVAPGQVEAVIEQPRPATVTELPRRQPRQRDAA